MPQFANDALPPKAQRAVFFDRDGVLNTDHGYVYRYEDWEWTEGATEVLALLKENDFRVLVVTNQSGIARGYYTETEMHQLHERINQEAGGAVDQFYFCPHGPDSKCECRKPRPGMLFAGLADWSLHPEDCILIGDKPSDLEAAKAAGVVGYSFHGGSLLARVREILGI